MKMEHYLSHTDYPVWQVIQNGNGHVYVTTDTNGMIKVLPPKTAEEVMARERERKARTTLLMALSEDRLAKFHKMDNAKEMWEAIKSRFGGNDKSKKMQKYLLKQQFKGFSGSASEGCKTDGEDIDWSGHVEEDTQNYDMMAYSSSNSGSNNESVFMNKASDLEDTIVNDRYANGMHAVLPHVTGNYMPYGPDVEINYFKFTYENASNVVREPKVWTDAPIIKEYESDSDNNSVSNVQEDKEKPSFAFTDFIKHDRNGHTRKGLGYAFPRKACFVCGSFIHLIRDCDFHEKRMAKQAELTKSKNKVIGQKENRLVWNNVHRVNHQNKFVPSVLLTKTGKFPVNTARQNHSSQATLTSTASKVNTARPFVNETRPKRNFYKTHSPHKRTFHNTTAQRTTFSYQKVNTVGNKSHSAVKGNWDTAVKDLAGCNWRNKRNSWHRVFNYNTSLEKSVKDPLGRLKSEMAWVLKRNGFLLFHVQDDPHKALKDKVIVDSRCSRHMTRNKAHLADYQEFKGGFVAFGGSNGRITGKGEIKAGRLDFEDVYYVEELKHYNLFSIS
nr:ribonuclease H-like domain-containing protein [Tanacetum cinerariifolium]